MKVFCCGLGTDCQVIYLCWAGRKISCGLLTNYRTVRTGIIEPRKSFLSGSRDCYIYRARRRLKFPLLGRGSSTQRNLTQTEEKEKSARPC